MSTSLGSNNPYYTEQSLSSIPFEKVSKEYVEELCRRRDIEYQEGYEKRVLLVNAANQEVDRAGKKILLHGGDLIGFSENPVVLWSHLITKPIGYSLVEKIECGLLKSLVLFLPPKDPTSGDVFLMFSSGFIKAASICIQPLVTEESKGISTISKWTLLEISICTMWHPMVNDEGEIVYNEWIKKGLVDEYKGLSYEIHTNEHNHNIAHFHVSDSDGSTSAAFEIGTCAKLTGHVAPRHKPMVAEWYTKNRNTLIKTWDRMREDKKDRIKNATSIRRET